MENEEYIKWLIGRNIYFTACPDHTLNRYVSFIVFVGMQHKDNVFCQSFQQFFTNTQYFTIFSMGSSSNFISIFANSE